LAVDKQIIIQPKVARNHLAKFVKNLEDEGIKMVFTDPKSLGKTKIQTIFTSQNADYVILDKPITKKLKGKKIGRKFKVSSNKDIENVLDSAKKGIRFCYNRSERLEDNSTRKYYCKTSQDSH